MVSKWTNRGVTFMNSQKRSKGICKTIKSLFAPDFNYKLLKNKPLNIGGLPFRVAKRKGKLIDKQLSKETLSSKKKCNEVKALLNKFDELGLEILNSQFVVANEETRLATQIDLILFHKETKITYLTEIKYSCHYRHCFIGDLRFQNNHKINDSLHHQHQLQILIGRWLHGSNNHVLLIYINTDLTIDVFTEDQFEAKLTMEGIQALKQHSSLTNKQLNQKKRKLSMSSTIANRRTIIKPLL